MLSVSPEGIARIRPARRLRGELWLPGDKSITHRALLLAGAAEGRSRVANGSDGLDCARTAACLRELGVAVRPHRASEGRGGPIGSSPATGIDWIVDSPGLAAWREPVGPLDCGNSGTTLRLLTGLLAGLPLLAILDGDRSLRGRPVARIVEPLRRMGATLHARASDTVPPLVVAGRSPLRAIEHRSPVPSAQVKSAVLLAALRAVGTTTVHEPVATRDHTERMLRQRGVDVATRETPDGGATVSLEGETKVQPLDEHVPGDPSAAAFWLVAAAAHPDAELTLRGVGANPTRLAAVDLLRTMGASIEERPLPSAGSEPSVDLVVRSSELEGIEVTAADVARAIDEIPVLCLAAALARGRSVFRGAGELRRKESDRLTGTARGLAELGAAVDVEGDDLIVRGRGPRGRGTLRDAEVEAADDHRLAMTFAVAGLVAAGASIRGAESVAVSYPRFFHDLERVRA